jgi:hypothetical protein
VRSREFLQPAALSAFAGTTLLRSFPLETRLAGQHGTHSGGGWDFHGPVEETPCRLAPCWLYGRDRTPLQLVLLRAISQLFPLRRELCQMINPPAPAIVERHEMFESIRQICSQGSSLREKQDKPYYVSPC